MKRIRLRTKFLLLFSIVSLIPLVFTLVLTYTRWQNTLEQDAIKLESQLAATASNKIKTFIVSEVGILNTVATLYDQQFRAKDAASEQIVSNILYRSENFTSLSIVSAEGQELIKQDRVVVFRDEDLKNISDTEAFQTVREKGLYVGPLYIQAGKPFFDLGRWILDAQGNFSGAVFARVNAKIMPEVMTNVSRIAGAGGRVFMVNEKGIVVAHPDLSYILGEKDLSSLPLTGKYNNENNEAVLGSSYPITLESSDIRLPEEYQTDWFVIVEQLQSVVFAEVNQFASFFTLISILILIAIVTASIYFARRISAPVESLLHATDEFGKGNLTYRTEIKANDEIGDLAQNFDQMAGKISDSIEKIKEEEKMKSEFVTITAHQLRTPLTGLKWSLDLLSTGETGGLNPNQKDLADKAAITANHMIELVNDLLNISQMEKGRFEIHPKPGQSLVPILEKIKGTFSNTGEQKNVSLKTYDIPQLPLLNMDTEKIQMVLENIVDNAIKYSKPSSTVELKVEPKEHEILISVRDSGIGISASEQERIFTKFFRSDRALLHQTDGTGLGLYVAKNIIEQHKGKIWFESKENEGTVFYISLPI